MEQQRGAKGRLVVIVIDGCSSGEGRALGDKSMHVLHAHAQPIDGWACLKSCKHTRNSYHQGGEGVCVCLLLFPV
jgi:hypothetical protein